MHRHLPLLLLAIVSTTASASSSGTAAIPGIMFIPRDVLARRAVCGFGEVCGSGCASGPCCDDAAGISCVEGSVCTDIGGVVGCCPAGETCDWLQECKDFAAEECAGEGAEGCCPEEAPYCDQARSICTAVPVSASASVASSSSSSSSSTLPPLRLAITTTTSSLASISPTTSLLPAEAETTILFETFETAVAVPTSLVLDEPFPTRTFDALDGARITAAAGTGTAQPSQPSGLIVPPAPLYPASNGTGFAGFAGNASAGTNVTGNMNLTRFESAAGGRARGAGAGTGGRVWPLVLGLGVAAGGFSLL
ncbi:hypothetical protein BZA05DRAFT_58243 [Tricharina praecox]|uniref:uncharacterized protein n=1 Tax=Tricharina praecox TaxID=43433 RepID=UPI00221EC859|nr:uncharacterized protein BZA05DRAFT_58243 [Tricharina praecox]KAI5850591.1 hypothetical protein BZA05DRAFT_58243 [Tricharina praecox]